MKTKLAVDFADLVYNGKWFTPLREALSAFALDTQKFVTGTVKLKLYKGNIITSSVTSPCTLCAPKTRPERTARRVVAPYTDILQLSLLPQGLDLVGQAPEVDEALGVLLVVVALAPTIAAGPGPPLQKVPRNKERLL